MTAKNYFDELYRVDVSAHIDVGCHTDKLSRSVPAHVRFFSRIIPVTESGCWIWIGETAGRGAYGRLRINTTKKLAHRYSWELHNGPIPNGLHVLHRCDVPACVNPAHLFLGTRKDNMQDKMRKGRAFIPDNSGENSGNARLTWDKVQGIRSEFINGELSQRLLARKHGLSEGHLSMILRNKAWKVEACNA